MALRGGFGRVWEALWGVDWSSVWFELVWVDAFGVVEVVYLILMLAAHCDV